MKRNAASLLFLFVLLNLLSIALCYYHYEPRITPLEQALEKRAALLTPTPEELAVWEAKQQQQTLKGEPAGQLAPYPGGHNPPDSEIRQELQQLKEDRRLAVKVLLAISAVASMVIWWLLGYVPTVRSKAR